MTSTTFPNIVVEVDGALTRHADLRASLQIQHDILKSSITKLNDCGDHEGQDELVGEQKIELDKVSTLASDCEAKWHEVNGKLHQSKDYLNTHLKLVEITTWIENAEAMLKVEEASVGDIDGLLRKQNTFERSLQQQQKEFADIKREAERLIAEDNFRKEDISFNLDQVE